MLTRLIERECIYSSRDPIIVALRTCSKNNKFHLRAHAYVATLNFINIVLLLITNYLLEAKFTAVRKLARTSLRISYTLNTNVECERQHDKK